MTFPLEQDGRTISAAPGARKTATTREQAIAAARQILESLAARGLAGVFARVVPEEPETEPLLADIGELVNGRVSLATHTAILPPSLRFDTSGHRLLGVRPYANGYTGFGVAPSEWRPGPAIWGFSESGLLRHEEYATPHEWLLELVAPFTTDITADGVDLERVAEELWRKISGDLADGAPAEPSAEIPDGVRVSRRDGLEHEENFKNGLRHGGARAWGIEEDYDEVDDAGEPVVRRTALRREGQYVEGFAEGPFRFYDELGRIAQEVGYVRGFPHGRGVVHPEATRGLCEAAIVEYVDGVPVAYEIPLHAYATTLVDRLDAAPATLAEIAGRGAVLLVDCSERATHELTPRAAAELAALVGVTLVGVGAAPGRGRLGAHDLEIVVDPRGELLRAYGCQGRSWSAVTAIAGATGRPLVSGRLEYFRFLPDRLGL